VRVGVDGACWANARGYGRFTRELLGAVVAVAPDDEFVFFVDAASHAVFDVSAPNVRQVHVAQRVAPTRAAAADGRRSLRDMLAFSRATAKEPLDVFFSPSVYTYYPLPPRLSGVVAVHDTIVERHPELTIPSKRARLFWAAKVRLALWQCRTVVTVSDFSANELQEVLRVPADRIRIVGEAASAVFRPSSAAAISDAAARIGLPADVRWVIYVGGFGPHKNVDDVVRAHAAVSRRTRGPLHLLLVGAVDDDPFYCDRDRITAAIADEGTESLVTWAGFLPDEELCPLLSGAVALMLPSAREGFGLPAVEAAACGTPVIATTFSPLPTLLAGGGFFVEPGDVGSLTERLATLATDDDLRATMGRIAQRCAEQLTWESGAAVAVDALRAACR
jgi:glycosyltransferase involved in cell wall biosynthesis